MTRLIPLVLLALTSSLAQAAPKYAKEVSTLSASHEFLRKQAARDYWKLIPYYLPMNDKSACGPTTLTMILNAMRVGKDLNASDKLITQAEVLAKIDIDKVGADPGTRGVGLDGFGRILAEGMKKFGIEGWKFEVVRASDKSDAAKKKLRELLASNEKSADDLIVPLFLQGELTGDPEGMKVGHFAPLGAFDGKRVLILDPDRDWYEPYWAPFEAFWAGMTGNADTIKPGGYIHISRK